MNVTLRHLLNHCYDIYIHDKRVGTCVLRSDNKKINLTSEVSLIDYISIYYAVLDNIERILRNEGKR